MPRPGTDVYITDGGAIGGPSLDTGQAFFAGVTERAPGDMPALHSHADYESKYGSDRSKGSLMYDALAAYFGEGGETAYISPVIGAGAAKATIAFGSATVNATSGGTWGNGVKVTAVAPTTELELVLASALPQAAGDPVVVTVEYPAGTIVERSTVLANVDELVAWSQSSGYVRVVKGADNTLPAAGTTVTLAGGTAGAAPGASDLGLALARFDTALGPGQLAAPGYTATASHLEVLKAIAAQRRVGLLDLPNTSDPAALAAAVSALYGVAGCRMAAAFAPWALYPTQPSPASVTMPYSGIQAGLIARADALGNPNQPAAGVNGVSRNALGLSQTFTDAQRQALNQVGATLAKQVYGDVRTYGGRTVAGPNDPNWLWFGNSRVIMAIAYEAEAIAEAYVLRQIDGRRQLFAALESDLSGMLLEHFKAGALYGDTPADAFYVDTGESVNTLETIAAGEVHADLYVKCSPAAEWVRIDIVKVPLELALPTAA